MLRNIRLSALGIPGTNTDNNGIWRNICYMDQHSLYKDRGGVKGHKLTDATLISSLGSHMFSSLSEIV